MQEKSISLKSFILNENSNKSDLARQGPPLPMEESRASGKVDEVVDCAVVHPCLRVGMPGHIWQSSVQHKHTRRPFLSLLRREHRQDQLFRAALWNGDLRPSECELLRLISPHPLDCCGPASVCPASSQ